MKNNKEQIRKKAIESLKESLLCCMVRKDGKEFKDAYDDWINDLSRQINEIKDIK